MLSGVGCLCLAFCWLSSSYLQTCWDEAHRVWSLAPVCAPNCFLSAWSLTRDKVSPGHCWWLVTEPGRVGPSSPSCCGHEQPMAGGQGRADVLLQQCLSWGAGDVPCSGE